MRFLVQYGPNRRDGEFDPFTHFMFGSQRPPVQPPHEFYQNNSWQASGTQPPQRPGFLKPFLDPNGHFDTGKMMNGATQLVTVIKQTAPAVKQLSPLLKFFKRP
ncbi:YppG family protein [Sporolactobacillus putidus]|uniref:YppG family protein n=1 Tax=Sporolactobacillus putidus TaxID=492735 RepID=UPI001E33DD52|nr:YppG family protein [Sporolactobacillus putidus]